MMNNKQYEQWKDWAYRFARTHYSKRQNPAIEEILEDLDTFFSDNSDPGEIDDWMDITDYVSELFDCVYSQIFYHVSDRQAIRLQALIDSGRWNEYDEMRGQIVLNYESPLNCCLRSGLDVIAGGLGVVGFSAGDALDMYPDGVPDWVNGEWIDSDGSPARLTDMPREAQIAL